MSGYQLTDEVKKKFTPIIQDFINTLEKADEDESEELSLELTGTEINPYTLRELLEGLGYEKGSIQDNGWQMDFWIPFSKAGYKPLIIEGTGITFELALKQNYMI